ncbi:hypothetical protein [Burkholderia savannae]|uniref:hypothetical protein n=1 Tax=Burkholderia savannae TaxID=1637837 RepID=UPI000AB8F46F|nr:hypothetical protein [Burkholderia savannae]
MRAVIARPPALPVAAQRADEQRERRRRLPAARMVEVRARIPRAPAVERTLEAALRDVNSSARRTIGLSDYRAIGDRPLDRA